MEDITFKINNMDITLSVDLNSEDYFRLTTDDDYAFKYIKELVVNKRLDLDEEDLKSLYRKDKDCYTLLYNAIDGDSQTSNEQAEDTDTNKSKWTSNGIKWLITERLKKDDVFTHPTCRKQKLWDVIARIIKNKTGLDVTGIDCNNKYRNLLQTYKSNKNKSVLKREAITWKYYKLFDHVLGTKLSAQNMLDGSLDIKNEESDITPEEPGGTRNNGPASSKKRNADEMILEHYLFVKQKRSEEMFKIRRQLKLKEIDAINNLAEAIRLFADYKKEP